MDLLDQLTELIEVRRMTKPRYLVGIDGPDAAGKSTLAARLAAELTPAVLTASIDGFHHPRAIRHAADRLTAEAFYLRTFDVTAAVAELLEPFRAGADQVRTATLDYGSDAVISPTAALPERAVLIVDGVFLQRPELRGYWDLSVYLDIAPELSQQRGVPRDVSDRRSYDELVVEYERRYLPGQALYRADCDPAARADVLVDNTDVNAPQILRWLPQPR